MRGRIRKHANWSKHFSNNTLSQAAFKVKPLSSQHPSSRSRPFCHFVLWQSAEKVCCSIIPLSLPDECGDLGHLGSTLNEYRRGLLCELWNSAAHDRQLLLVMSACQRGHSLRHCCYGLLLLLARLLMDTCLALRPSVAGRVWTETRYGPALVWMNSANKTEWEGNNLSQTTTLETTRSER